MTARQATPRGGPRRANAQGAPAPPTAPTHRPFPPTLPIACRRALLPLPHHPPPTPHGRARRGPGPAAMCYLGFPAVQPAGAPAAADKPEATEVGTAGRAQAEGPPAPARGLRPRRGAGARVGPLQARGRPRGVGPGGCAAAAHCATRAAPRWEGARARRAAARPPVPAPPRPAADRLRQPPAGLLRRLHDAVLQGAAAARPRGGGRRRDGAARGCGRGARARCWPRARARNRAPACGQAPQPPVHAPPRAPRPLLSRRSWSATTRSTPTRTGRRAPLPTSARWSPAARRRRTCPSSAPRRAARAARAGECLLKLRAGGPWRGIGRRRALSRRAPRARLWVGCCGWARAAARPPTARAAPQPRPPPAPLPPGPAPTPTTSLSTVSAPRPAGASRARAPGRAGLSQCGAPPACTIPLARP
jgi:hypothetical protein